MIWYLSCIIVSFFMITVQAKGDLDDDFDMRTIVLESEQEECSLADKNIEFADPLIISLGWNCMPAKMLRHYGLRVHAFPFDWVRTSFNGLCNILENSFADLFNPRYLQLVHPTFVLNTKYTLSFHHDFPSKLNALNYEIIFPNYLDSLGVVKDKYDKRIERFNQALCSGRTIYFLRTSSVYWDLDTMTQKRSDIERLRAILLRKMPQGNFVIIATGFTPEYQANWNTDKVRNFFLADCGSIDQWRPIFSAMGFIP